MLIFPFPVKTTPPLSALGMGTEGAEQPRVSHGGSGMELLRSPSPEPPVQLLPLEAASALWWPEGSHMLGAQVCKACCK